MTDTVLLPKSHIDDPTATPDVFSLYGKYLIRKALTTPAAAPKTPRHTAPIPSVAAEAASPVYVPIYSTEQPRDDVKPVVGILGAGPGGLYAAMILTTLDIPFEILEAQDRTGGRLYTYQFNDPKYDDYMTGHDYYVCSCYSIARTRLTRILRLGCRCHAFP